MALIAPSHPLARIAVAPASLPCDEHAPPERAATSGDRGGDWRLHLLAILLLSTVYVGWHLGRGWVAHDDGALAQSAMRLLAGELPHRDFDELYSGGLTFLNAAMFRLLGATLFTMRVPLLLAFLASLPAIFYIATRFVRPAAATAITLLCVVWTLPNYPAPLPSWYNLFLAVAGIAAVFRWLETGRSRWLVVAGIAGGLSLLVKVVGLYFIAGALLHLVYEAHRRSLAGADASKDRAWGYALFVSAGLALFSLALLGVVRRQLHVGEFIQFVVPGALVTGFLLWNEWSHPAGPSAARFAVLARLIGPFAIGLIIPVAVFLIPFIRGGAVTALMTGVFILPTKRFGLASFLMLGPSYAFALLPPILLFAARRHIAAGAQRYRLAALACALVAYLLATATVPVLYRGVWFAARWSPPLLVATGVYLLLTRTRCVEGNDALMRSRTVLLLCVASVVTLVQFPFSVPIYFCYTAPLVILVAVALSRFDRLAVPAFYGMAIAFLGLFAVLRMNTSSLYGMGLRYIPYSPVVSTGPLGGGVRVPIREADMYRAVTRVLQRHSRGEYTWASPDCPEIYFLSGLKNPTRTLFDFFDDEDGRTARVLAMLEQHRITAIALNANPNFTNGIRADLVSALESRYPYATNIGKFQVRWQ